MVQYQISSGVYGLFNSSLYHIDMQDTSYWNERIHFLSNCVHERRPVRVRTRLRVKQVTGEHAETLNSYSLNLYVFHKRFIYSYVHATKLT